MDNQQKKKKRERELLDQFKLVYPDFPKGKIFASESPDFILNPNRKRTTGIELIQLFPKNKNLLESIQTAIDKKEEKLRLYQKKILEIYWLIITTDSLHLFKFNIQNLVDKHDFETKFDKVFLFDSNTTKIYHLGTCKE